MPPKKRRKFAGRKRRVALTIMAMLACSIATVPAQAATKVVRAPLSPVIPVVLVHGYSNGSLGGPQGLNATSYWSGARSMLASQGFPLTDTYPVSYYQNDTNGVDVTGQGPGGSCPMTIITGHPRQAYSHTTSIEQISHDFAWCMYNAFGTQPIDLVGHSMGGLIIRYALQHIANGDQSFPSALNVHLVVTFASPFGGVDLGCKDVQCNEMLAGSNFLTALDADTPSITQWVAVSSGKGLTGSYCDTVHTESATDIAGILIVYTNPCYSHLGYLSDTSTALNGVATGPTDGRRALNELGWLFSQSGYGV